MAKIWERKRPPSQEPVVAPAKPVANKLDISPLFKLISVAIAALTSFCLLVSMLFTLRYPDPPAIPSSEFFFRAGNDGIRGLQRVARRQGAVDSPPPIRWGSGRRGSP